VSIDSHSSGSFSFSYVELLVREEDIDPQPEATSFLLRSVSAETRPLPFLVKLVPELRVMVRVVVGVVSFAFWCWGFHRQGILLWTPLFLGTGGEGEVETGRGGGRLKVQVSVDLGGSERRDVGQGGVTDSLGE
jgi:hypothetical protein